MGQPAYLEAKGLPITARAGGGIRARLWKYQVQKLSDETGSGRHGLRLSSGNQQAEQDRTSDVETGAPRGKRIGERRSSVRGATLNGNPVSQRPGKPLPLIPAYLVASEPNPGRSGPLRNLASGGSLLEIH